MGTPSAVFALRRGIKRGVIRIESVVIATGDDRLDTLAGQIYGNSRYWWLLAAASNIGWGLQVPPGTVIYVPNLTDTEGVFN